jgi:hypothetical protein
MNVIDETTIELLIELKIKFKRARAKGTDPCSKENKLYHRTHLITLDVAIQNAVRYSPLNGRKHKHHRAPTKSLREFESRLLNIQKELRTAKNFAKLLSLIEQEAMTIQRIGELTSYDAAHRIGIFLKLAPTLVYLHTGTAEGARALGYTGKTIDPKDLPTALSGLTPAEVEDFLCIYKEQLKHDALRRRKEAA